MSETFYCRVCQTPLNQKYGNCPYCGYSNRLNFTVSADDSDDYRSDCLNKINGLSIKANVYQWNATSNQYEEKGSVELFDPNLNGADYFNAPVFSKEWIAHFEGQADIVVEYTFGGSKRRVPARVQVEPKEGIWHLGLHINEALRLEILRRVMSVNENSVIETSTLCIVDLNLHT